MAHHHHPHHAHTHTADGASVTGMAMVSVYSTDAAVNISKTGGGDDYAVRHGRDGGGAGGHGASPPHHHNPAIRVTVGVGGGVATITPAGGGADGPSQLLRTATVSVVAPGTGVVSRVGDGGGAGGAIIESVVTRENTKGSSDEEKKTGTTGGGGGGMSSGNGTQTSPGAGGGGGGAAAGAGAGSGAAAGSGAGRRNYAEADGDPDAVAITANAKRGVTVYGTPPLQSREIGPSASLMLLASNELIQHQLNQKLRQHAAAAAAAANPSAGSQGDAGMSKSGGGDAVRDMTESPVPVATIRGLSTRPAPNNMDSNRTLASAGGGAGVATHHTLGGSTHGGGVALTVGQYATATPGAAGAGFGSVPASAKALDTAGGAFATVKVQSNRGGTTNGNAAAAARSTRVNVKGSGRGSGGAGGRPRGHQNPYEVRGSGSGSGGRKVDGRPNTALSAAASESERSYRQCWIGVTYIISLLQLISLVVVCANVFALYAPIYAECIGESDEFVCTASPRCFWDRSKKGSCQILGSPHNVASCLGVAISFAGLWSIVKALSSCCTIANGCGRGDCATCCGGCCEGCGIECGCGSHGWLAVEPSSCGGGVVWCVDRYRRNRFYRQLLIEQNQYLHLLYQQQQQQLQQMQQPRNSGSGSRAGATPSTSTARAAAAAAGGTAAAVSPKNTKPRSDRSNRSRAPLVPLIPPNLTAPQTAAFIRAFAASTAAAPSGLAAITESKSAGAAAAAAAAAVMALTPTPGAVAIASGGAGTSGRPGGAGGVRFSTSLLPTSVEEWMRVTPDLNIAGAHWNRVPLSSPLIYALDFVFINLLSLISCGLIIGLEFGDPLLAGVCLVLSVINSIRVTEHCSIC